MLLANYLEPGYHNLLVLPFRLWVLLAHYQFPSSTFIVQYCAPNVSIFLENWLLISDTGCCFSINSVSSSVHAKLSVFRRPSLSSPLWILPSVPPSPSDHFFFSFLVSAFIYIVCHFHCLLRQLRCCNFHWRIIVMSIWSNIATDWSNESNLITSYFMKQLNIRQFYIVWKYVHYMPAHACV